MIVPNKIKLLILLESFYLVNFCFNIIIIFNEQVK